MAVYSVMKCFFKRGPVSMQFDTLESAKEMFVSFADEVMNPDSGLHKVLLYKIETLEDGEIIVTDIESMSWQDAFISTSKNGF